eukprot:COSAG04_NODE_2346_length_4291_cov_35.546040_1_plen_447_part_10
MASRAVLLAAAAAMAGSGAAPPPGLWRVSVADSMTNVRRDYRPYGGASMSTEGVYLDMARNEREGAQLVVIAPAAEPVLGLRWAAGQPRCTPPSPCTKLKDAGIASADLRDADGRSLAGRLDMAPLGYIHASPCSWDTTAGDCPVDRPHFCKFGTNAAPGKPNCTDVRPVLDHEPNSCLGCAGSLGGPLQNGLNDLSGFGVDPSLPFDAAESWWPFPLLDHVNTSDVAPGRAQAIYLTVTTELAARAGKYTGVVELRDAERFVHVPIIVHVHDFAIPVAHSLPSFWGVSLSAQKKVYGPGWGLEDDWKFAEMLLSHRVPAATGVYSGLDQAFAANATNLRRLWKKGQRWLILGDTSGCIGCEAPAKPTGPCDLNATDPPDRNCCHAQHQYSCNSDCFAETLPPIKTAYQQAMAAGWPANQTAVFLVDEASHLDVWYCIPTAVKAIQA